MNEHISAGCSFYESETLFVVEPFNFSQFLAHYSDSFVKRCHYGERNRGHYTKMGRAVKLTERPNFRLGQGVGESCFAAALILWGIQARMCEKTLSLRIEIDVGRLGEDDCAIRNRYAM